MHVQARAKVVPAVMDTSPMHEGEQVALIGDTPSPRPCAQGMA